MPRKAARPRCPRFGKTQFRSYGHIMRAIGKIDQKARPYRCKACGWYHMTSETRAEYDRMQAMGDTLRRDIGLAEPAGYTEQEPTMQTPATPTGQPTEQTTDLARWRAGLDQHTPTEVEALLREHIAKAIEAFATTRTGWPEPGRRPGALIVGRIEGEANGFAIAARIARTGKSNLPI